MRMDVIKALRGLGEMFKREVPEELMRIWLIVLSDLSEEEFKAGFKAYLLDQDLCRFFPQPGQIYGLARPEQDKEEQASVIVDSIFTSLRNYGPDAFNENRAKLKIGPVGWKYIQNQGGWGVFVASVRSEDDVPILRSQARKSLMGILQVEKIDNLNKEITLEALGVKMKELKND